MGAMVIGNDASGGVLGKAKLVNKCVDGSRGGLPWIFCSQSSSGSIARIGK